MAEGQGLGSQEVGFMTCCVINIPIARCRTGFTNSEACCSQAILFSTTEVLGSSQNPQTAAPKTSRLAATMNGACQEPNWTRTPNTSGDKAPPILPAMFILPETVPECSPPISMGTAQDGPIVHSGKNMAAVKQ